jgi:hypothetical protein
MAGIDNVTGHDTLTLIGEPTSALPTNFMTYIRPIHLDSCAVAYGVYSEDGAQLAIFGSYDAAFYSARQNNLTPVNVH